MKTGLSRRPYFLDLRLIRLPVGGWVSILHRASGAGLALVLPGLLWLLMRSLDSPEGFREVRGLLGGAPGALAMLIVVWATLYHFVAGLRHLGFDVGLGLAKAAERRSAWATLALALVATLWLALGIWA